MLGPPASVAQAPATALLPLRLSLDRQGAAFAKREGENAVAMLSKIPTTAKIVLGSVVAILLLVGGVVAYLQWDARGNYVAAKARVTAVVDNCSLER